MNHDTSDWPAIQVIYQEGYHYELFELFSAALTGFRLKVIGATGEAEARRQLDQQQVRLVIVAGWGTGPVNPKTGEIRVKGGESWNGFDGWKLAQVARNAAPHVPIILSSGYCFPEAVLNKIDRLGFGFLAKPFRIEELADILLLLLWRGGAAARTADEFFSCGHLKQITGDARGAAQDFSRALEMNTSDAESLNHRSTVWRTLGDAAGALADAEAAIRLQPAVAEYYCSRGLAHGLGHNDAQAEADFTHCLRLQPLVHYWSYRSIARERQGDFAGALADLNAIESQCRSNAGFYERRGELKKLAGDLRGAMQDYDRAERVRAA